MRPSPFVLTILLLAGCHSAASGPSSTTVASVTVSGPDTLHYLESVQLTAAIRDPAGTSLSGYPVTWSSANPSVATVSPSGLVQYVGPGTAFISAVAGGKSGQLGITSLGLSFVELSLGQLFGCGLAPWGTAYCWGGLGSGKVYAPEAVPSPVSFTSIASGGSSEVCGLAAAGALYCWTPMSAQAGQMGTLDFETVSLGSAHSCALQSSGSAYCWGYNNLGQLGTESPPVDHALPTAVAGGLSFADISAGTNHTCAIAAGGSAYCWGSNSNGQLGASAGLRADTPVAVTGGLTFMQVAAGGMHSCAVALDQSVYCWGAGASGQLGTGDSTGSAAPMPVAGGLKAGSVATGTLHTCAVSISGSAYCWGDNAVAELGDGSTTPRYLPVPVTGGHSFSQIAVGGSQSCGLTAAGVAWCWGDNTFGELGVSGIPGSPSPVKVAGQP